MDKIMSITDLANLAENDIKKAANYDIKSDNGKLAKEIYNCLFDFYDGKAFSGDVIFTWKSPSLVKDGCYIGKREKPVDNKRVIGNIFPNNLSNKKFSLNLNRNGYMGSFPHDFFDIYLDHVAKYAYGENVPNINEYYPLIRAIEYEDNIKYFNIFDGFDDFLKRNYLKEIWDKSKENPFFYMEFNLFQQISSELMENRGEQMLKNIIKYKNNKSLGLE
jgi:hypothetical protein